MTGYDMILLATPSRSVDGKTLIVTIGVYIKGAIPVEIARHCSSLEEMERLGVRPQSMVDEHLATAKSCWSAEDLVRILEHACRDFTPVAECRVVSYEGAPS